MSRRGSFAAMLTVVGASVILGMILGGRLNAPPVARAARSVAAAPATMPLPLASIAPEGASALPDFADVVEQTIPAVVAVVNTSVKSDARDGDPHQMFRDDPMFRFFFGPQQERRDRQTPPRRVQSGGSGFVISPDGYVLTNNHVVEDASKIEVLLNDGSRYTAELVGRDPNIDLAVIKIDPKGKTLPSLRLGDSDRLRVGQWVIAIGNPLQLEETVTAGIVSAKNRRVDIGDTDRNLVAFIQTDAAINFGNSGGPLLDVRGNVVGINTAINRGMMAEGIGFALPINTAREAMEQIRTTGKVRRGYLGLGMVDVSDEAREYYRLEGGGGALVQSVVPGGPADKAGIRAEDIIRKVDGTPVEKSQDLVDRVAARKPGDSMRLEILREGRSTDVTVKLSQRPDAKDLVAGREGGEGEEEGEPEPEGSSPSANLGLRVEPLTPRTRSEFRVPDEVRGVVLRDVETGSEAFEKGIRPGGVVIAVNDRPVETVADWRRQIGEVKPGRVVKLRIRYADNAPAVVFLRVPEKP